MNDAIERPMTCVTTFSEGPAEYHFVQQTSWGFNPSEGGGLWFVFLDDGDHVREVPTHEVEKTPTGIRFTSLHGNVYDIRDPYESDVIDVGWSTFSWPLPMLYSVLRGESTVSIGDFEMFALVSPTGFVMTLVTMEGDTGAYARYASMWHPVNDMASLDGGMLVEVEPDVSVEIYDQADNAGMQSPIDEFPTLNSVKVAEAVSAAAMPAVAASAGVSLPVINTVDDFPVALAYGSAHPESRWFIEKRARALDPEVQFPWAE